jgi:hypothetical protein
LVVEDFIKSYEPVVASEPRPEPSARDTKT